MEEFLVGILLLIAGFGLTFAGLRIFMFMLPIFGFVTGFFFGASLIANWLDAGFLSTVAGWIVGIILGVIFALLSYLYWYVGAILAAASAGAVLGMSLMALFGVETSWIYWVAGLIGAGILGFLAIVARLPVYMVAVSTAIGGATMVIAALLLFLNQVDLENLAWGAWHEINTSWLWWIAAILLAGVGIAVQWTDIAETPLPEERWVRADASARQAAAVSSDRESRGI